MKISDYSNFKSNFFNTPNNSIEKSNDSKTMPQDSKITSTVIFDKTKNFENIETGIYSRKDIQNKVFKNGNSVLKGFDFKTLEELEKELNGSHKDFEKIESKIKSLTGDGSPILLNNLKKLSRFFSDEISNEQFHIKNNIQAQKSIKNLKESLNSQKEIFSQLPGSIDEINDIDELKFSKLKISLENKEAAISSKNIDLNELSGLI